MNNILFHFRSSLLISTLFQASLISSVINFKCHLQVFYEQLTA